MLNHPEGNYVPRIGLLTDIVQIASFFDELKYIFQTDKMTQYNPHMKLKLDEHKNGGYVLCYIISLCYIITLYHVIIYIMI